MRKRKIRVTINVPSHYREVLRRMAKIKGKSVNQYVIDYIASWVKERKEEDGKI